MNDMNRRLALGGLGAAVLGLFTPRARQAHAANDGISRLIAVTQMKADQANEDALKAADKQRELVKKQKELRSQQQETERLKEIERSQKRYAEISANLKQIAAELKKNPC